MIDHISLGVRDLAASAVLYDRVLAALGYTRLVTRASTVGFGKKYADFWLNHRPGLVRDPASGTHVCLRARSQEVVHAFHAGALAAGARDAGAPGPRPEYHPAYYAAFIRDFDEHVIEVVTFLSSDAS